MRIAICDDIESQVLENKEAIMQYLKSYNDLNVSIKTFNNPYDLIDEQNKNPFAIILLDICMPNMLGTTCAKLIRKSTDRAKTEIIFLTSSNEYALEAFEVNAAHYLIKPYTKDQFNEAISRVFKDIQTNKKQNILINSVKSTVKQIDINEIYYIESYKHELNIHLKDEVIIECRRSLEKLLNDLQELDKCIFISPYRGYIVNMKHIMTILPKKIILINNIEIPIVERNFRKIKDLFFEYFFRKESNGDNN